MLMSRPCSYLLALCFLLTVSAFTLAQESPEPENANDKAAFELLETIVEGLPSLRTMENRVYFASSVADSLWSSDEKRARALFDSVTREMISALAAFDPGEHEEVWKIQQQRREIVERMARHDPVLAISFLRA